MLTISQTFSAPPFIRKAQIGSIASIPGLRFCLVEFDRQHFSETTSLQLGIPCPPPLRTASIKRQAEYLAGRYCATELLQEAGSETLLVPFSREAPEWPAGWCGSLSHTTDRAIAVLVPAGTGLSPGVDVENSRPGGMLETAGLFTVAGEQALLEASSLSLIQGLLVVFSAKESLYKSLWPQVRRFFGFGVAEAIAIDTERASLRLTLTEDLTPVLRCGATFTVYYRLNDHGVITCVC